MKVTVKKVTKEESIIEVQTLKGVEVLTIKETQYGHSYNDFSEWNITDDNYYDLEELVEDIMKRMGGEESSLEITYEY